MSPLLFAHFHRSSSESPTVVLLRVLLLIALAATSVSAQVGGIDPDPGDKGTGGRNSIQGRIFLPGGRKLDVRAKVRLRSTVGDDQFQLSDDSGAFTFRRIRGGTYTVSVDAGNDYDITSETVDIIEPSRRQHDSGIIYTVTVMLQPRHNALPGKTGVVDASTAGAPEEARELYKRALESAQSGDRKKAVEELKQAVKIYPSFMTAFNELGVQYMNLKEWDKAAESLRAAIKIGPEALHPRLNYGIVLLQLKDYKSATAELQIAVQKDSSSAVAHFQFGRALVNVGNYDAAEKALRQSISLGGEAFAEAHRYLGAVYIEKGDSSRAADELDTYLKLEPKAKDADRIRGIVKDLRRQASAPRK